MQNACAKEHVHRLMMLSRRGGETERRIREDLYYAISNSVGNYLALPNQEAIPIMCPDCIITAGKYVVKGEC